MVKMTTTIEHYGMIDDKQVYDGVTSGRVFVPKAWIGKKVTVILLEPLPEE